MDKLNTKHFMFIIFGTTIVSLKTDLSVFLRDGGRDSWISLIISSFLIMLYLIYIIDIYMRNNIFSFTAIYKIALGNILGSALVFILLLNFILVLIECTSIEASSMHTGIFIETPIWYLQLFFVIPALYTINKGIVPVITVSMIGVIIAMLAGINLVLLSSKYKHYEYLLPIMADGLTPGIIYSIFKSLGLYSFLIIAFPFIHDVKDKTKLKKHSIIGLLIVIQMCVVGVIGAIATFGPERAMNLSYPKLTQTQEIDVFGFLESGELFVMFQIIGGWYVKYILTFYVLLKLLRDMNFKNKLIMYPISIIVLISAYLASKDLFLLFQLLNYYSYICLFNFIIIPIIVFTLFDFKTRYTEKKEGSK